jgi:hypothetical protein
MSDREPYDPRKMYPGDLASVIARAFGLLVGLAVVVYLVLAFFGLV